MTTLRVLPRICLLALMLLTSALLEAKQTAPSTTTTKGSQSTTSVRCKGITKAKQQCKHMTKDKSGYCYQHKAQGGQK